MRILYALLMKIFIPVFIVTLLFFVMIFEFIDLFSNLWNYAKFDVPLDQIGYIALLYLPKCLAYSVPVALLFSVSYALGILYTNNEMVAVFGAGVSLYRFVIPLFLMGVIFSIGMFYFEEQIVISTYKSKNDFTRKVLKMVENYSRDNVTVSSPDNTIVYHAGRYDDARKRLTSVIVLEKNEQQQFVRRVDAEIGEWKENRWVFTNCRIFTNVADFIAQEFKDEYSSDKYVQEPELFRQATKKVEELKEADAKIYIASLKSAHLPFQEALSEYYRKFSFPLICLIVVLISSSIGSLFQRNFVLLSLISSLGIVIGFYILQLVTMTLARNGYIAPEIGAWFPFFLFLLVGGGLFKISHT